MSLIHLPVGIIILIAKCLRGKNRTLASLAPCNQLLRDIATPVLYSYIKLSPRKTSGKQAVDPWIPHIIRVS